MTDQPTYSDAAVNITVIDELPPDRRTNAPNGAQFYETRGARWFVAINGLLEPGQPPRPTAAAGQPPVIPSGRGRLIAVLVVFAAIVVGIIALAVVRTVQKGPMFGGGPTLTAAEAECNKGRSGGDLADGGKTLVIDAKGESPTEQARGGMALDTVACILDYLKAPTAVRSHIEGTRAVDGRQTDSWDGFTAAWTYHPDDGLDMTIEQR